MNGGKNMKKYVNAEIELHNINVGDIMLTSEGEVDLEHIAKNEDKAYNSWGNWNS